MNDPSDLVEETRAMARESSVPVKQMCADAEVGRRWLHRFIAGDFKEPGANKVKRLHDALKAHTLIDKRSGEVERRKATP